MFFDGTSQFFFPENKIWSEWRYSCEQNTPQYKNISLIVVYLWKKKQPIQNFLMEHTLHLKNADYS